MRRIHGDAFRAVFVTKCADAGLGNWAVGLAAAVLGASLDENLFAAITKSHSTQEPIRMENGLLYCSGFPLSEDAISYVLKRLDA